MIRSPGHAPAAWFLVASLLLPAAASAQEPGPASGDREVESVTGRGDDVPLAGPLRPPQGSSQDAPPAPPPECGAVWQEQPARELVALLAAATASQRPVWVDYGLDDGTYVVHAGPADSGRACVGVWAGGAVVAHAALPEEPKLLTPLFGFYLPHDAEGDEEVPGIFQAASQPPSVAAWLQELGVENATIVPVRIEDFPIEMTALLKAQTAIHEGFHVTVQSPSWTGPSSVWPAWDEQPDWEELGACYSIRPDVEAQLAEEREGLVRLVEALLDGDGAAACEAGSSFLERRRARYALVEDVRLTLDDGTPAGCFEGEAIMELDEGTADYASWTRLYELGLASRERLLGRYRARQDQVFYLTGAMQLHAISLMSTRPMVEVTRGIAESASPEEGAITAVLSRTLESYCE